MTEQQNQPTASTAVTLDDLDMPKAIIARLIKAALPEGMAVKTEARTAMTKACTIFINFITATANEISKRAGLKTISPAHIIKALEETEYSDIIPIVKSGLAEHRKGKKTRKKNPDAAAADAMLIDSPAAPTPDSAALPKDELLELIEEELDNDDDNNDDNNDEEEEEEEDDDDGEDDDLEGNDDDGNDDQVSASGGAGGAGGDGGCGGKRKRDLDADGEPEPVAKIPATSDV